MLGGYRYNHRGDERLSAPPASDHYRKTLPHISGKKVVYLKRISMGVLTLPDDLKKGECRQLTAEEEKRLKESVVIK